MPKATDDHKRRWLAGQPAHAVYEADGDSVRTHCGKVLVGVVIVAAIADVVPCQGCMAELSKRHLYGEHNREHERERKIVVTKTRKTRSVR